ncbi:glycosyl hydrolase family 28 protein [Actinoallomurus vinaceus]|uniref:Glycosyl hydrolase family 28 protein n=1 Tax=Actinoallomurus vinaceus TaxID=1080074 RepID=A0ABP8UT35_9ACTN
MRRSLIPATGLAAAGLVVLTLTPATAATSAAPSRGTSAAAFGADAAAVGDVATRAVAVASGDSRTVSEPVRPATCVALPAGLTASSRKFTGSQEASPPDTDRVQAALTQCAGTGKAVELTASGTNTAFLTGPLTIGGGVTLLIDSGVTLYGSLNPAGYQVSGKPTCGTVADDSGGCKPLITVSGAHAGLMGVRDSSGHQGTVDARGDLPLYGQSASWWDIALQAKNSGKKQNNPRMVQASGDDFTVYDVNLINSPNFHIAYKGNGFTVWGVRIKTPATAKNTDGIDPSGSNVTINDSYIEAGDDGIAIKAGSSSATNMTIENSHFYGTHGISIGSETNAGASNILFRNNTVSGKDSAGNVSTSNNGIRIKSDSSRGGKVSRVTYQNTCLTGVKEPLVFDPYYSSSTGSLIPSFTDVLVDGARAVSSPSGTVSTLDGYSASYPLGLTLRNVQFDVTKTTAQYAAIGVYNTDLAPSGTGVTVTSVSGGGSVPTCTFPAFPKL